MYLQVNVVFCSEIFKGNKLQTKQINVKDWFGEVGQNLGEKVWMHRDRSHMVSFEAVVPFLWFLSQGTFLTYLKQGPL